MTTLALSLLFAIVSGAASPRIEIDPSPGETLTATITGPASGVPTGEFRGSVALYGAGAPVEIPVAGRAERSGAGLRVSARLRYADIPAEWGVRFRPDGFDYRIRGTVGAAPLEWQGRLAWSDVAVEAEEETAARFLKLAGIELTSFSPSGSRGVARITVVNPFSFPLTIASTRYRIEAAGRAVGQGSTRGIILRARRTSTVDFPVEIDHGQLIAAAGSAFVMSGDVDAELKGSLTIRLPGGDVRVPVELAGRIDAGDLIRSR